MTPTELKVLKIIWENKGKVSTTKIANELRVSTDYSRLICGSLIRNKIITLSLGRYKITNLAREELKRAGLIKEVVRRLKKKARAKKKKKKAWLAITELSILTPKLIKILKQKGFRTLEDIAITSVPRLMETIKGLKLKKAAGMINEARSMLRKEGKEYLWGEGNNSLK